MDLQGLLRYPMRIVIIGFLLSLSLFLGEYLGMSLFISFLIDEINDNRLQIWFFFNFFIFLSSLFLFKKKRYAVSLFFLQLNVVYNLKLVTTFA